jgi:hypothetical protein
LSVPAYFASVASTDGMLVGQTLAVYKPTAEPLLAALTDGLGGVVVAIGSTGMAVAAIIGLTLDNLIPGTDEQRGLKPGILVPEAGSIDAGISQSRDTIDTK